MFWTLWRKPIPKGTYIATYSGLIQEYNTKNARKKKKTDYLKIESSSDSDDTDLKEFLAIAQEPKKKRLRDCVSSHRKYAVSRVLKFDLC